MSTKCIPLEPLDKVNALNKLINVILFGEMIIFIYTLS